MRTTMRRAALSLPLRSVTLSSFTHAQSSQARQGVEHVLTVVGRLARLGLAATKTVLSIAVGLGQIVAQLGGDVCRYIIDQQLRSFLRFGLGILFLGGALFLLKMPVWHLPDIGSDSVISCVTSLPLRDSV
ncbi:hypothetical protein Q4I28_003505 [Leishmania naiffi]|uniref:Uncharacterized protein n=1 Tax=Leishmania naiffi TaxID=5678 RepID=A0AAW3BT91_9TRYP